MTALKVFHLVYPSEFFRFRPVSTLGHVLKRQSSNAAGVDSDLKNENSQADIEEDEEALVGRMRNVSGLSEKYYQQYHGAVIEPAFKDLKRRRNSYTMYGSQSGEHPRQLWPSRQELRKMQQEDHFDDVPLLEKIEIMKQAQDEQLKAISDRHKTIEKNMAQMNKWISDYYKKVDEAENEIQRKKDKKEALLDEAREYFGYRIKAHDPKFQQMVEEKEERERKEAKERKKSEKARKLAERLRQDVLAMKSTKVEAEENPAEKNS